MGILLVARHESIYNEGASAENGFHLLTGMWWYSTSYAFLVFLPFAA